MDQQSQLVLEMGTMLMMCSPERQDWLSYFLLVNDSIILKS